MSRFLNSEKWHLSSDVTLPVPLGMVEEIFPRESELAEPGVANVDLVMVLVAAENPPVRGTTCPLSMGCFALY